MNDEAFPGKHKITKLKLVTRAVDRAIRELLDITRPETAFIAIIAFGDKPVLIPDKQGQPMLTSVEQFQTQFGDGLDEYLYDCFQEDRPGVDRSQTDITAALQYAYDLYNGAFSGNLSRFGIGKTVSLMEHTDVFTHANRQISVANARVMIYSVHNPGIGHYSFLTNPFASLEPSPLMSAFIGDGSVNDDIRKGADQMKDIANVCPMHGQKGYFLINTPERYAVLRVFSEWCRVHRAFVRNALSLSLVLGKNEHRVRMRISSERQRHEPRSGATLNNRSQGWRGAAQVRGGV